jgi:hypothetical protein
MSPLSPPARHQLHTVALRLGLLTFVVQLVGVVAVGSRHGPSTVMLHLVVGLVLSAGLVAFGLRRHGKPDAPARRQRLG